jgi:hypothetical protein
VRHIALEIPLGLLAFGGRRECDDATGARIQPLRNALDNPALAGGIAPLEDHDDLSERRRLGPGRPNRLRDELRLLFSEFDAAVLRMAV